MSSKLRWQQGWGVPPAGNEPTLLYSEAWSESFALEQTEDLDLVGTPAITGNVSCSVNHSIGSGTLDTVGHTGFSTVSFDYPEENVLAISGMLNTFGRTLLTGEIDYEEPIYLDPPLELYPVGHAGISGAVTAMIGKSIGSGVMNQIGHVGFSTTSLSYGSAIIKQLYSVTLSATGRAGLSGSIASTPIKEIGPGVLTLGREIFIVQDSFTISAPPPFTLELGGLAVGLIGGINVIGDPGDWPTHEISSGTVGMTGHTGLSTYGLFTGGILNFPPLSLPMVGRTSLWSAFSYPGVKEVSTEIVAVYEGLDMQGTYADLESDGVVVD